MNSSRCKSIVAHVLFCAGLFLWAFVLRSPSFLRSTIGWDESLYTVVADQWLKGSLPYIGCWDLKPIGIYLILKTALGLFGASVFAIRIITIIFVSLTSVIIYGIGRKLFSDRRIAASCAVLYPPFSLGLEGLSANAELFFIPFFSLAVWFLIHWYTQPDQQGRRRTVWIFLAGLAVGIAFQVKYIVIVEAVPVVLFFLAHLLIHPGRRRLLRIGGLVVVGAVAAALPTLLAMGYYWAHGQLDEYIYNNFTVNQQHLGREFNNFRWADSVRDWFAWCYPLIFAAVLGVLAPRPRSGRTAFAGRLCLAVWLAGGLWESWITRAFYQHYYQVTLVPLCLAAGYGLWHLRQSICSRGILVLCLSVMCALPIGQTSFQYFLFIKHAQKYGGDLETRIGRYLREHIDTDDTIFVLYDSPIIYFLSGAKLPSRYIYPPIVYESRLSRMARVDTPKLIDTILATHPKYIVATTRPLPVSAQAWRPVILERIQNTYFLETTIGDVELYRRKIP